MKKSSWKRALALGMVFVMTLGAAGCNNGKGGDANTPGGKNGVAADPSLAKQYVYRCQDIDLGIDSSEMNITASRKAGDRVEFLIQSYDYSENGSGQKLQFVSVNDDGGDVKKTELKAFSFGEGAGSGESTSDGSSDTATGKIVTDSVILPAPADAEVGEDGEWSEDYEVENTYYQSACLSEDAIYAVATYNKSTSKNGVYENVNKTYVCSWDKEGKQLFSADYDMQKYQNDDTYSYISRMISMGDGKIALIMSGDQNGMAYVGKDGSVSEVKPFSGDKDVFSKDPAIAERPDGKLLVSYYSDDWTKQYLTVFDPATGNFGEEYSIPDSARYNGFYSFSAGIDKDVLFSSNEGVFGFNLGDKEATKIMDFVNSDLSTYSVNSIVPIDANNFVASYQDTVNYNTILAKFTYVKPEDIQDKKVLVFAGVYVDTNVKSQIIRFNKKDSEYRITIHDYSQYNTEDDYSAGFTKLNNDLIAGNVPDILALSEGMPVDSFINKGLFVDIGELIQNDPELSKLDYMENVFEAYKVNGKLYRVIPSFVLRTWIGKKSLVGDRASWTMNDVRQAAEQLNGDKSIFGMNMTRDNFLSVVMNYIGNDFFDVDTGKCNFDSKNFTEILEYAKTLPQSQDSGYDEEYWQHYWETYQTQYRENRTLLMELYLSDFESMRYNVNGMMGEDVSYIGFPSDNGTGSVITLYNSYAIYAKSSNQDGAWKFLRTYLTEDYQKNEDYKYGYTGGLPVLKSLVRELVDKTMEKPYWTDENGEKHEYDDTFYINDQEIILQPFTKAQADTLYDFVCNVKTPSYYDENVMKIISEEVASFFSGSKSASDVANMIQNRVQLYVNENK